MNTIPSPKDLPAPQREAMVEFLAAETALYQVVARPLTSIGEIPVYRAESVEALVLRDHPEVITATGDAHIRSLLEGPHGPIILVTRELGHTQASLSHLVPEGAKGKALLLEQSA